MDMTLDSFIVDCINKTVELGGSLVSDEEYNRRIKICKSCDFHNIVKVAGQKMEGCMLCGCPTATKPRYETYFSLAKFKIIKAECPHKSGDKWAIVADK